MVSHKNICFVATVDSAVSAFLLGHLKELSKYYKITVIVNDESKTFNNYADLEAEYITDKIGPQHLKPACSDAINEIIEPVRKHFSSGEAKKLLDRIKSFKVTR